VVIGDRTGSAEIVSALMEEGCRLEIVAVDEHMSSMEARERYLRETRKGIARFVPIGLRTPKEPYDDYVAEILHALF